MLVSWHSPRKHDIKHMEVELFAAFMAGVAMGGL